MRTFSQWIWIGLSLTLLAYRAPAATQVCWREILRLGTTEADVMEQRLYDAVFENSRHRYLAYPNAIAETVGPDPVELVDDISVYADWCDDHGRADSASLMRRLNELYRLQNYGTDDDSARIAEIETEMAGGLVDRATAEWKAGPYGPQLEQLGSFPLFSWEGLPISRARAPIVESGDEQTAAVSLPVGVSYSVTVNGQPVVTSSDGPPTSTHLTMNIGNVRISIQIGGG